ncbi:hypothetical protein [Streptomyces sp. NBC_01304]|uniref:hypothetical protein n=1 Tax=Streptomyces sp. NBC_01304 TaxID=2903818 RepID=UPI002E13D5AE|nr:hypothetical protein OG430_47810 [Streptomyces sp. NBC_01304]
MHTPEPHAVPAASAAAFRAAMDGVGHARETARTVALAVLADACDGDVRQYLRSPGALNSRVTSRFGTVRIVPESDGDRAQSDITVSPAAYERISEHLLEECFHDEECTCLEDPWPAVQDLPRDTEIKLLDIGGTVRGTATRSPFGRGDVALVLNNQSVIETAEILRIAAQTPDLA